MNKPQLVALVKEKTTGTMFATIVADTASGWCENHLHEAVKRLTDHPLPKANSRRPQVSPEEKLAIDYFVSIVSKANLFRDASAQKSHAGQKRHLKRFKNA